MTDQPRYLDTAVSVSTQTSNFCILHILDWTILAQKKVRTKIGEVVVVLCVLPKREKEGVAIFFAQLPHAGL